MAAGIIGDEQRRVYVNDFFRGHLKFATSKPKRLGQKSATTFHSDRAQLQLTTVTAVTDVCDVIGGGPFVTS